MTTAPKYEGDAGTMAPHRNAVKLSASWQDKPLAERSRSRQKHFGSAQRTA
jgi:hypothetical protein